MVLLVIEWVVVVVGLMGIRCVRYVRVAEHGSGELLVVAYRIAVKGASPYVILPDIFGNKMFPVGEIASQNRCGGGSVNIMCANPKNIST